MQANSVNRAAINWVGFTKNLLAQASGANTIQQAYPAVVVAIVALGDKHNAIGPTERRTATALFSQVVWHR